jgi:serine/threonine protein kinase
MPTPRGGVSQLSSAGAAHDLQSDALVFEHSRGARDPQITRNYKLERLIAVGGMGHVFAARRRRDHRRVALKILQPPDPQDPRYREYMLHEVYALTVGANPALVDLVEFGETSSGTSYMVLDWLDGPNLGDVFAIESPLPTRRALQLFTGLLDAVDALHERGVIHGDLKPDNLMVVRSPDGAERVMLVDLGTARVGDSHVSLSDEVHGTPGYIAPEVIAGEPMTPQSDVYAAGVVLFELLTGSAPFEVDNLRPSDHRANGFLALDAVVATALEPDPRRRYHSVAALRAAFEAAIDPQVAAQDLAGIPRISMPTAELPTSPYRRAVSSVR